MDPDIRSALLVIRDRLKNSIEQQQLLVNRLQHLQDVVVATQREDTRLAKAKAEIDKLETDCDREAMWRKETEHKLAEAKVELEKLNAHISELVAQHTEDATYIGRLCEQCRNAYQKLDEVATDAEIGRMVRGMRPHTRLWHDEDGWYIAQRLDKEDGHRTINWETLGHRGGDPAEALRAIQNA